MTTLYRTLWIVTLLVGLANVMMLFVSIGLPCMIATVVCLVSCGVTYKDAWRDGR